MKKSKAFGSGKKSIETDILFRNFTIKRSEVDEEARTVPLAFSSENPVERWFGDEILSHEKGHVRMQRLNDGGALLVDHDSRDIVGTVEKASIDSDKVGRALVRFGNSVRASEVFQDVLDGIRTGVSVGYAIHEMTQEVDSKGRGLDVYRANDWEPFEVSIVAVPADHTVGVMRDGKQIKISTTVRSVEEIERGDKIVKRDEHGNLIDDDGNIVEKAVAKRGQIDINRERAAARDEARKDERERAHAIGKLGEQHKQVELARKAIAEGKTVDEFQGDLLRVIGTPVPVGASDVGMSEKEVRRFSFVRAIHALAHPGDRRAQDAAAYEYECSDAACDANKVETQGIRVPNDVLKKRDQTVGTAGAGGNLVGTDLDGFIDTLEAVSMALQKGTVLSGLVGNIAIPRATGGSTAYWLAESGAITESAATFDQVTMTPKTIGAWIDISRKLTQQSSIDIEAFVRREIAMRLGLGIDTAALNGSGASNQPTGILQTSGIGAVAGGTNGAAPDWADVVDLETAISQDNALAGSLSYMTNYKVAGKLKKTLRTATYGEGMILEKHEMNGYPVDVTNQVPSDLDKGTSTGVCSALIMGNWLDLFIGLWGGLDLMVDPFSESTKGTVRVVAFQDCDIAVRHAESFAAMQDALTT